MEIVKCRETDYVVLAGIWERSVKATHDFLSKNDFDTIKSALIPEYFPGVDLYAVSDGNKTAGFIGVSGDMIEMLFVDCDRRRQGYGSALIDFAIQQGATHVDVNEQNRSALKFYITKGFHIIGRDETDADGRPYPILHLSFNKGNHGIL